MRRELIAIAIALAATGAIALAVGACTSDLCGRTSDCSGGTVCTPVGVCAVPADAPGDGSADTAVPNTHVPPDAPHTEHQ